MDRVVLAKTQPDIDAALSAVYERFRVGDLDPNAPCPATEGWYSHFEMATLLAANGGGAAMRAVVEEGARSGGRVGAAAALFWAALFWSDSCK
jgi:hypothetical protein